MSPPPDTNDSISIYEANADEPVIPSQYLKLAIMTLISSSGAMSQPQEVAQPRSSYMIEMTIRDYPPPSA